MQSVFIIDHRPILRLGLRYLIEQSFEHVQLFDFNNIYDLPPISQTTMIPELIFLGVESDLRQLQDMSELKTTYANTKVIVYDPEGKADEGIEFLRSGANGYLSKGSDLGMLGNCIQNVMEGRFYIDPIDLHDLVKGLVNSNRKIKGRTRGNRSSLTSRQSQIAKLLAQGMRTSKIANTLGLKSSTVSTVKATIYGKLKIDNVVDLRNAMI